MNIVILGVVQALKDLESIKKEMNEEYQNLENICKELGRQKEELRVLFSGANNLTCNVHHPAGGLHRMHLKGTNILLKIVSDQKVDVNPTSHGARHTNLYYKLPHLWMRWSQ